MATLKTTQEHSVLLLPGDGIGPLVFETIRPVLGWIAKRSTYRIVFKTALAGASAIRANGTPVLPSTMELARQATAILFGAVGDPEFDDLDYDQRPAYALLSLWRELNLFANVRAARTFPGLEHVSPLRTDLARGLDVIFVRELAGGLYHGKPRGLSELGSGKRRGVNTLTYDSDEIRRCTHVAIDIARRRSCRICSLDKSTMLETSRLWREEVTALVHKVAPDVTISHQQVDDFAGQFVVNPASYDVVLTDNMFGDILSDCALMLTGTPWLLWSASVGPLREDGTRPGLYEPMHGAWKGLGPEDADQVSPLGILLGFAQLMRWSLGAELDARRLEKAVAAVVDLSAQSSDKFHRYAARSGSAKQTVDQVLVELERNI